MTDSNFDFISRLSFRIIHYTQFPVDVCCFIACQFALESSYGESSLARTSCNFSGMKNPLVRVSSAIHAGDPLFHWAQYSDLDSCIIDYLFCLQFHRPLSTDYDTIEHFACFISKFYCPEKDYIDKINRIYLQFQNFQNNGKN